MLRREWLSVLAGAAFAGPEAGAKYAPAVSEWNRAVEPFRIAGDLYYVGASGVSAFLLVASEGNVLIDTGFRETVPLVEAGVRKLGFRMESIRLLLASHAHYDHVAGLAEVKRRTRARFLANPKDMEAFRRGGRGDFALGDKYPFEPVEPDGAIEEGKALVVGKSGLTAHFMPGHTKGNTTYTLQVEEGGRLHRVVIAASLSAPGYRLAGNAAYPEIVRDYETSFRKMRALPCDIFLSGHGWDFGLEEKSKARLAGGKANPFVKAGECAAYADRMEAALRKQVVEQRG